MEPRYFDNARKCIEEQNTIARIYRTVSGVFVPPFSVVDYRRYAAECVRLAQRVEEPLDKARLLDMAETFRELADKNEEKDRRDAED
jgi:hypothetical protein